MEALTLGTANAAVRDVQQRLEELGFSSGDDPPAEFGEGTRVAVRGFQQDRGLPADGVVGDDTWRALVEASRSLGDRRLYLTDPMLRGDDVRELQRRLNRLGFDAGYEDGVFGPHTTEAVREFQLNVGLRVDGIVGGEVVSSLRRLHRWHQSAPAATVREREALRAAPPRPTLAGARILLDPGHGPDDPGYQGPDGTTEHEVTWAIANRIEGRLLARGVHVIQSRGPRTTPSPSERARLANDEDVELILSMHLNGLDSAAARGCAAYYFGDGSFVSESGRRLAELAVKAVHRRTHAPHLRTHPSTTAIVRESRAPAVLVEPGFLTHPEEGQWLAQPAYQEEIAEALTQALTRFLTGDAELRAAS
ncbi:MAG: N-acetylmuramoyl-L-alanine amidase [Actinobacteria bacterium]|nr:N-acetylmuramoyl-L-alanine amidase [Actinomycetota bacterium]